MVFKLSGDFSNCHHGKGHELNTVHMDKYDKIEPTRRYSYHILLQQNQIDGLNLKSEYMEPSFVGIPFWKDPP